MTKKIFKGLFLFTIVLNLSVVLFVTYASKYNDDVLVDMKYLFFTDFSRDSAFLDSPPEYMYANGFKTDSDIRTEQWAKTAREKLHDFSLLEHRGKNLSRIDKAKWIVLEFIKNGSECSKSIDLVEKLIAMEKGGYGCCTDHSEAFLAIAKLFDISAREVHTNNHVTVEFYNSEKGKWIWLDPLYAIAAQDQSGEYLSLKELREYYMHDKKMKFEFFGADSPYFRDNDPYLKTYYDSKEDFTDIMVTWGNNVLRKNDFNSKLAFVPKSIRQMIGLTSGVHPSFIKYFDDNAFKAQKQIKRKSLYLLSLFILLIVNTFTLLLWVYRKKINILSEKIKLKR